MRENDVGVLEGRADDEAWQAMRDVFDDWILHQRREKTLQGGETCDDIQNRFVPFVESLIQKRADAGGNLLCVGHGGLYWTALPRVLKNVDVEFINRNNGFDYASFVVAELTPAGLVCVEWNGVVLVK